MQNEIMKLFNANPKQCLKSFHDMIMKLEIQEKNNPFIGIFAAPRSASRFTSVILTQCLKLKEISVIIVEESSEHELLNQVNEIDYLKLLYYGPENHLIHTHLMANPLTLRAIERLKIIPIVTRRSIPDSLVSLRYEIERQWISLLREIDRRGFITGFFGTLSSKTVNKFLNNEFEYKMDFLIDVCSPWYFLFLESWENAAAKGLPVYFVEYENIMTDSVKELSSILGYLNYSVDTDKLQTLIDLVKKDNRKDINLRVGKKGSGREKLTPQQMARIKKIGNNFGYDIARFTE